LPEPAKPGESYSDFSKAVEEAQLPASAVDHERARRFFFELPLEERKAAILGLKLRIASGEFENPVFRPRPDNYLRNRVWERPVREKRKRHTWREKIEATNQRVKQWAQEMDRWIAQRKQERAAQTI